MRQSYRRVKCGLKWIATFSVNKWQNWDQIQIFELLTEGVFPKLDQRAAFICKPGALHSAGLATVLACDDLGAHSHLCTIVLIPVLLKEGHQERSEPWPMLPSGRANGWQPAVSEPTFLSLACNVDQ